METTRRATALSRILLVEDSPTQARIVTASLEQTEYDLESAERLSEAVELIRNGPFGAVILDLSLPDSEGLDTYLKMQEAAPNTPIVVLTSTDDEELALQLLRSGAQDYLVKGEVTSRWIVRAIRNAVERSNATRSRLPSERSENQPIRLEVDEIGDVTVLRIHEPQLFADEQIEQLSSRIFKLVDEEGRLKLVLNCDHVDYLSNSVLSRLLKWDDKIRQRNGRLRICNLRHDVQDQIKARRLLSQLDICLDEEAALRFF